MRSRFVVRFSLRVMMIVVMVVGGVMGWVVRRAIKPDQVTPISFASFCNQSEPHAAETSS
jgi:hypothetical protein